MQSRIEHPSSRTREERWRSTSRKRRPRAARRSFTPTCALSTVTRGPHGPTCVGSASGWPDRGRRLAARTKRAGRAWAAAASSDNPATAGGGKTMKKFIKSKKGLALLATLVVAVAASVGAYAYFTTSGSGSGNAQVGDATALVINATV